MCIYAAIQQYQLGPPPIDQIDLFKNDLPLIGCVPKKSTQKNVNVYNEYDF